MVGKRYILSIDIGTTNVKASIYDVVDGRLLGITSSRLNKYTPKPNWVEQDPEELWSKTLYVLKKAFEKTGIEFNQVGGLGIANQRGSIIVWDKRSGKPLYNIITWQCRRTEGIVDKLMNMKKFFKEKTGLIPSSNFSLPKILWVLENIPRLRDRLVRGDAVATTIDTFIVWRLSGGRVYVTDYTNASRTMLFNIVRLEWDSELFELARVPIDAFPGIEPSAAIHGYTSEDVFGASIPIATIIGDQQASCFGHLLVSLGDTKCTHGTGSFILTNVGEEPLFSENLLTTIAWSTRDKVVYALEGSIPATGSIIDWLVSVLGVSKSYSELEELAKKTSRSNLVFIPSPLGLGAPYWRSSIKAGFIGLDISVDKGSIVRAVYESIVFMVKRIIEEIENTINTRIKELRVDGGISRSDFLLQLHADVLEARIVRPKYLETTLLGTSYLAGLALEYYRSIGDIESLWRIDRVFEPIRENTVVYKRKYILWKNVLEKLVNSF